MRCHQGCYESGVRRLAAAATVIVLALTAPTSVGASTLTWADLRGGTVVLLRHALAPGIGDPANFDLDDCRTQRNLSSLGRRQAQEIGAKVRAAGVDVSAVLSSPWCRSRETARLLDIGPVYTRQFLGSSFTARPAIAAAREGRTRALIDDHAGRPGVLFIVGHQVNIADVTGVAPSSGEAVVVRSDGRGGLRVLGTIPAPG